MNHKAHISLEICEKSHGTGGLGLLNLLPHPQSHDEV